MNEIATIAELNVKIGATTSELKKELAASQRQLKRFNSDMPSLIPDNAGTIMAGFGAAIALAAGKAVKLSSAMEMNKISFTTMLGSAEAADVMLTKLATLAAGSPFGFTELTESSKKMLGLGVAAQDVLPWLTTIGDTVSAFGGGTAQVQSISDAFAKMLAQGTMAADQMNRLSDAGIPGWKLLAQVLNVDVATAMAMAEKKSINASVAIQGMMNVMSTQYAGSMAKASNTVTGQLSNMGDVATQIATKMGDSISKGLDLTSAIGNANKQLDAFAAKIDSVGIGKALMDLIPDQAIVASMTAVVAFSAAKFVPVMAEIAVVAGRARLAMSAFNLAIGPVGWAITALTLAYTEFYLATADVREANEKASVAVSNVAANTYDLGTSMTQANPEAANMAVNMYDIGTAANEAAHRVTDAANNINYATRAMDEFNKKFAHTSEHRNVSTEREVPDTPTPPPRATSLINEKADTSGIDKAAKAWEDLQEKAKQVSESIEREWVQLTYSQIEQLNKWRVDEIKALNESATANANYVRDKQRVEETYAARKKKIDEEELNRQSQLKRTAQDIMSSYNNKTMSIGVTGVDKQVLDLKAGMDKEISSVTRTYEDMVKEFATLDTTAKANNIKTWKEAGLAFKANEDGTISFAEQAEKEKLAIRKDYAAQAKQLHYDRVKYEESLDEAHRDGNIAAFAAQLSSEQALLAQDLSGRQEMIDVYYQVWQDSHRTAVSYMAEAAQGLYGGMTTMFTGLLDGTKSLSDAWAGLGRAVVGVIAQMAAQWIAGRIMMAIFDKKKTAEELASEAAKSAATVAGYTAATAAAVAYYAAKTAAVTASDTAIATLATTTLAATTAASTVAGLAIAAAWAPAAAMVSLASFGANSGPAIAGITAANVTAMGFTVPALANGGITTGPSLAMIGDNKRYDEVVMPLDKKVFEKMGLTNNQEQSTGDVYHISISGNDGPSIRKMIMEEGATIVKSIKKQARGFNVPGVSL